MGAAGRHGAAVVGTTAAAAGGAGHGLAAARELTARDGCYKPTPALAENVSPHSRIRANVVLFPADAFECDVMEARNVVAGSTVFVDK